MILNCKRYNRKRLVQRASWLQDVKIEWFHVIGDETLQSEYVYDGKERILKVRCKDTYAELPRKTYIAIKAVTELFPDVEYVLKTDDDMQCDIGNLESAMKTMRGFDYGGQIISTIAHTSTYHYPNVAPEMRRPIHLDETLYCPGRMYFLSRKAMNYLLTYREFMYKQMFEDYAVGYTVSRMPEVKLCMLNAHDIFYDVLSGDKPNHS